MFNIVHLEHVCTLCNSVRAHIWIIANYTVLGSNKHIHTYCGNAYTYCTYGGPSSACHAFCMFAANARSAHVRVNQIIVPPPSNSIMSIVFITPHDEHNTSHAGAYNKPFAVVVIIICQCASCALMWRDGFATAAACNIRRLLPIIDTMHEMRHHDTCTFTVPKRCPSVLPLIYNYPALKRCTIAKGVFESMSIIRLVCVCGFVCMCARSHYHNTQMRV